MGNARIRSLQRKIVGIVVGVSATAADRVSDWLAGGGACRRTFKTGARAVTHEISDGRCSVRMNERTACGADSGSAQQHDLTAGAAEADVSDDRKFTRHRLAGSTVTIEPEEQRHTLAALR